MELITSDDTVSIGNGLRLLKKMADELSVAVVIGSSGNMQFQQGKRNPFERYADAILTLRKNDQDYTTEIIIHDESDTRYDYDDKLRGLVQINTESAILAKYPVEVQVRTKDGLLGSVFLQYMPRKGVFADGE